jgi:hypothetical protein
MNCSPHDLTHLIHPTKQKGETTMNNWLLKANALAVRVLTYRPQLADERGLSQSTENAILLAGAVAIAGIIITVITAYVRAHLPK